MYHKIKLNGVIKMEKNCKILLEKNKDKRGNEAKYMMNITVEDIQLSFIPSEIKRAIKRANKNQEDFEKEGIFDKLKSWWGC
jgi:hypothetical protein